MRTGTVLNLLLIYVYYAIHAVKYHNCWYLEDDNKVEIHVNES